MMIRLLFFVALVLCLGFGFAWLADRPGDMTIVWQGREIEMSLMTAVVIVVSLVASIMIIWWFIRTLITSPRVVSRYFRASKRDRGYQALSTGLLAAGAGDAVMARKMNKRTKGLLNADQEPLIHLLDVQAALIEGRNDEARKLFEAMAEDPETRLLGLRGLYLEAQRQGAAEAAQHYAETAAEQAPQLPWAAQAALDYRTREGKWDEALQLLDRQRQVGSVDAKVADRNKAVLLSARGRENVDSDPLKARDDALMALKLAPGFVPAVLVAAKALLRQDNLRKAAKIMETAWKLNPHPEIAETYVMARVGDTTSDRLKRAERLEKIKPMHAQSLDVVARAALAAHKFDLARQKAEASARLAPCEGIYLLLADIEEADTGDQARVRHWLSQAVRAPRDPAWTADGYVSETWEPVSPVTGRIDAFEWKVPVEQLAGPSIDNEPQGSSFEKAMASLPPVQVSAPVAAVAAATVETKAVETPSSEPEMVVAEAVKEETSAEVKVEVNDVSVDKPDSVADDKAPDEAPVEREAGASKPVDKLTDKPVDKADDKGVETETAEVNMSDPEAEARAKDEAFLAYRPDDPGIDANAEPEKPGRFRLF